MLCKILDAFPIYCLLKIDCVNNTGQYKSAVLNPEIHLTIHHCCCYSILEVDLREAIFLDV